MRQESTDKLYFKTHWDRSGKVRTLFTVDKENVRNPLEFQLFGLKKDRVGGSVGIIKAESSNAAYRIAQEHTLCIFMDKRECKHTESRDSIISNQDGAM